MTHNFFANIKGDQGSATPPLLPTGKAAGAPPKSLYLLQFSEDEVEVRHSGDNANHPGHPYISFRAEVLEPSDFSGRAVYGMFYYPGDLDENATAEQANSVERRRAQFIGAIDAVLGEGTMAEIDGDDLEEALLTVVDRLAGETFVGKLGVKKAQMQDGEELFPAKNQIRYFYPASEWQGEVNRY